MFAVHGAVYGTWVARIPGVKATAALSDSRLGLVLLAMGIGTFCALPLASTLLARWPGRRLTGVAAIGICAGLAATGFAAPLGFTGLLWMAAVFGAAIGTMDVSMNANAAMLEQAWGRSIMSSFHAVWSLGTLGAAALGATLAGHGMAPPLHFALVAALLAVVALFAWHASAPFAPSAKGSALAWPSRAVLGVGLLGAAGGIVEGGVADWCGVLLGEHLSAPPGVAALGYAAFALAMLAGRLGGDRVIDRFGPTRVLRAGAWLSAVALLVAFSSAWPWLAIASFAVAGLGVSVNFPIAFSLAGRLGGNAPGAAIAAVATMVYGSGLSGPPLIGFLAEWITLPRALWLLVLLCALIALFAKK